MGRPCSICKLSSRSEIDSDGDSLDRVAKRFAISRAALYRHRQHAPKRVTLTISRDRAKRSSRRPGLAKAIDARTVALETLAALREAMKDVEPSDVPSVANAITSAARLLARLSGQLEISQTQIVRSLPWRNLMELLDGVLAKHPAAAKAWAAALGTVDA